MREPVRRKTCPTCAEAGHRRRAVRVSVDVEWGVMTLGCIYDHVWFWPWDREALRYYQTVPEAWEPQQARFG